MLLLGNDIVDLKQAGVRGKWQHSRFVARVFTKAEQTFIQDSPEPDLALWSLWAAKESAYKLISKITSPPVFSHKRFAAVLQDAMQVNSGGAPFSMPINFEDQVISIEIKITRNYILAEGQFASGGAAADYDVISGVEQITAAEEAEWPNELLLEKKFSAAERESIHHAAAARARILCKQAITKKISGDISRLQIIRPVRGGKSQPPYVLHDDQRCDIDISLSHHGQWVAWCGSVPEETGQQKQPSEGSH